MSANALLIVLAGLVAQIPAQPRREVRVGVVAFEDFHDPFRRYSQLFNHLTDSADSPLRFRLAVGSYAEVVHWLQTAEIDVAVITPGLFAAGGSGDAGPPAYRALATIGLPAASSKWAMPDRQAAGYHSFYRSICCVAAGSPLKSMGDVRQAARSGRVRLLFVHPLSVSGRIAPQFALREIGIDCKAANVEYTDSHTASLRMLARVDAKDLLVAFVWDDALHGAAELADAVRAVPFPELDRLLTPQDLVVARADFADAESVKALLLDHLDAAGEHDFLPTEAEQEHFAAVRRWSQAVGADPLEQSQLASLDEIGRSLLQHARSQPKPPRLAVVLSGGGAKCAYQVGAVTALEEMLARLRAENRQTGLDIELVVGTSGGAINALPIALGVTGSPEGAKDFRRVWTSLDQRRIVRPSRLVRGNIGLWFALLQTAVVLWLVRRFTSRPEKQGWLFGGIFAALAAVELLAAYLPWSPWTALGENHIVHHTWLWLILGVDASTGSLLALGIALLAAQALLARRGKHLSVPIRATHWVLAIGLLSLPLVQIVCVLFHEQTLSGGQGIEHALADKLPPLIDGELARRKLGRLTLPKNADDAARLQEISRQVLTRKALARDLVITGSCVAQSDPAIPADLYFYAAAVADRPPPLFGPHGMPLAEHPAILLDAIMGSGSIYPLFPSRRLENFPASGQSVELVDGGFAHNSPIEAAVLWGATHIVCIEASPQERDQRNNFLQNSLASFDHLYAQSQLLDARSHGKVTVFTLAPRAPHLCVLDFADNLIDQAIDKGYRDASGKSRGTAPMAASPARFRKELGLPIFADRETMSNQR